MPQLRFEEQFPEPVRFWIVHPPRRWRGPVGWWLDIAREELVDGDRATDDRAAVPDGPRDLTDLNDVAYLPPVLAVNNWWRQELRDRLSEAGAEPIVQFQPGEEIEAGGGVPILDLTPALLPPKLGLLEAVPAGVHCCWPLIPGLTADEQVCRNGLDRLATAGVSGVQPMAPALTAGIRRRLGDLTNRSGYRELFHGPPQDLRRFSRWASEAGLAAFVERPTCGRSGRALTNRRIATRLHMIGELIHRTGGSVDESLSFYRAGRWADHEALDIEDLVRCRNLALVSEITDENAREIELFVHRQESDRYSQLEREYFGSEIATEGP